MRHICRQFSLCFLSNVNERPLLTQCFQPNLGVVCKKGKCGYLDWAVERGKAPPKNDSTWERETDSGKDTITRALVGLLYIKGLAKVPRRAFRAL